MVDSDFALIANNIANFTRLETLHLNLAGNKIGPEGISILSESIKFLSNLKELDLNFQK